MPISERQTASSEPTGLLMIRAWMEPGSSQPLRASVRLSSDVSVGVDRAVTMVRVEDVCSTVEEWLADFICHSECSAAETSQGAGSEPDMAPGQG